MLLHDCVFEGKKNGKPSANGGASFRHCDNISNDALTALELQDNDIGQMMETKMGEVK